MRKAIKVILSVVIVVVVAFVGIGLLLPNAYHVERSIVIAADTPTIHALVGDLKRWPEWTPWQEADPSIRIVQGTTTSGAGAQQSWTGDSGSGELTITQSSPDTGIRYDLSFDEGAFQSEAALLYSPEGAATRVTWQMSGDAGMNIVGRYFGVMMDRMVGPMFESGLEKLKATAEKGS